MAAEGSPANNATANTLNYALGNLGGKQKSWMQSAHPNPPPSDPTARPLPFTARRRGRPPKNHKPQSSHQPQTTETAYPTIEPQAETQPPSNSTSPQLANVMTRQDNANHSASVVTVFPSPTPSEENTRDATAPALRGAAAAANLDFLELGTEQANHVPETPLEPVAIGGAQRGRLGQKRPPADAGAVAQKRAHFSGNVQERPTTLASTPVQSPAIPTLPQYRESLRRSSLPQAHVSSPQLEQIHSRSPSFGQNPPHAAASPQLLQGMPVHRVGGNSPQAPFSPPRTISWGTVPHPLSVAIETASVGIGTALPHSPRYVHQPAWYTVGECLHALTAFQSSYAVSSDYPRDGSRINVLKDATEMQDWPYLIMHQFYCLLEFNPKLLPPDLRHQPSLKQALRVMQDVLDTNKHLSPAVLHFFCNYPCHLEEIRARWPACLEQHARMFLSFVAHSPNYDQLKLTCERRRCPPLAWELAHYLGLGSTTFQRLLFTAILRCIWRGVPHKSQQSQYEARAVNLFQQNQANYYQRISPVANGRYSNTDLVQDNESDLRHWGTLLKQVVEEHEAHMRHQGYSTSTPYIAIPPHTQQQPIQSQQNPQQVSSHTRRSVQPHSAQAATQRTRGRGRPRMQPVPPTHILPSQFQAQQDRAGLPLLPASGWIQPQQRQPNPMRFSLHQASLRSPVLEARSVESPLYHIVQGYVKSPARLSSAGRAVEKWSFSLDAEMTRCIATTVPAARDEVDRRLVDTQSKTVRLRCVKWLATNLPNEHDWAITDTSWIPYSYFTFNGTSLQQRRKVHHGKDLPIDVTGLLKEGENVLEMTVMAQSNDTSYRNYLVAIEFLGVISHTSVKRHCLEKYRIPAHIVLSDIKKKLCGSNEDDDFAIVESNLTINLFDPFSASKICDVPVRSKACLHNDCFDLDTFLNTRKRKGAATVPDLWRCPICNADARPHHLVVDGFLETVKKHLDAQGLSNTRAIIVLQDGTWKPKLEVRDPNGVSDRGTSEPQTPTVARASISAQAEIIDLSD